MFYFFFFLFLGNVNFADNNIFPPKVSGFFKNCITLRISLKNVPIIKMVYRKLSHIYVRLAFTFLLHKIEKY